MTTNINMVHSKSESGSGDIRKLVWVAPLVMAAATIANTALYFTAGAVITKVSRFLTGDFSR